MGVLPWSSSTATASDPAGPLPYTDRDETRPCSQSQLPQTDTEIWCYCKSEHVILTDFYEPCVFHYDLVFAKSASPSCHDNWWRNCSEIRTHPRMKAWAQNPPLLFDIRSELEVRTTRREKGHHYCQISLHKRITVHKSERPAGLSNIQKVRRVSSSTDVNLNWS